MCTNIRRAHDVLTLPPVKIRWQTRGHKDEDGKHCQAKDQGSCTWSCKDAGRRSPLFALSEAQSNRAAAAAHSAWCWDVIHFFMRSFVPWANPSISVSKPWNGGHNVLHRMRPISVPQFNVGYPFTAMWVVIMIVHVEKKCRAADNTSNALPHSAQTSARRIIPDHGERRFQPGFQLFRNNTAWHQKWPSQFLPLCRLPLPPAANSPANLFIWYWPQSTAWWILMAIIYR